MIIDKNLIVEAKNIMGEDAARLIAKDLNLHEWDDSKLKSLCPFHKEDSGSFIWDGKENSNFFKCFGCGARYSIVDHYIGFYKLTFLEAVQRLFEETGIKFRFSEKGLKAKREYKYPQYIEDDNKNIILEYFKKRKISKETVEHCGVKQCNGIIFWDFYDENDTLLTVKCRNPRKPQPKEIKEWYLPEYDYTPILYNMNKVDTSQKSLVITEGQIDCLSVIESGYKNCVSVPGGTENLKWIENCFDWLEQFERIIIWADNDDPGIKMRKEIASRLGAWRCSYVEIPDDLIASNKILKDANEVLYFYGTEKVLEFINNAQEAPVVGVVSLAQVPEFDLEKAPGLFSGLKPIDDIVYKFLFGSVCILTGKRGDGKSSFLNQVFINEALHQGYDIFCFSGELDTKVLQSWIEINMAGSEKIEMRNNFVHVIDTEAKKEIRKWYDNRIWVYDENNNDAENILDKAITVTRKYGVKVWILDNLMTLDIGANDTNIYQKQKEFIVRLTNLAKLYNVLIVLVAHPRKTSAMQTDLIVDDIGGSGDLGNMAQYVISAHRVTQKEKDGEKNGKGGYKVGKEPVKHDVAIDFLKNRYTGKLGKSMLYFNYPDYRFYSTPKELWKRYAWNKDTSPLPSHDPNKHEVMPPEFESDG